MSSAALHRSLIPGDQEMAPLVLEGAKRRVVLAAYYAILLTSLGGTAYTLWFNPAWGLTALGIGYFFDNLAFCSGHLMFHAAFIEAREREMGTTVHHAFIHHYRNVRVFHETWLETRISYFFEPRGALDRKTIGNVAIAALALAASSWFVHPVLGIALYSGVVTPVLLQSTIHEWYHCPPSQRKAFYSRPAWWFFTALEKTGLASTQGHSIHHRHGLGNLGEVDKWLDLYIPFGEAYAESQWRKALSLHEPGKARMFEFMRRGTPAYLRLAFRVATLLLIAASYYWLVE